MTKAIAIHSYKGGTGKSTVSTNLAATLCKNGKNVVLFDMDVYAPSMHMYFDLKPTKWINDYLFESADIHDTLIDLTNIVENNNQQNNVNVGKLLCGFANSSKDEIYKLEGSVRNETSKLQLLRKFILMKEQILDNVDVDYFILDTSPGIRYWSINSLAISDIIFLVLKMTDLDISGTKLLIDEIYKNFESLGTKPYILLNRAQGYCQPPIKLNDHNDHSSVEQPEKKSNNIEEIVSKEMNMEIISKLPCYCDIQFDQREFLTVLKYPDHPFANDLLMLSKKI